MKNNTIGGIILAVVAALLYFNRQSQAKAGKLPPPVWEPPGWTPPGYTPVITPGFDPGWPDPGYTPPVYVPPLGGIVYRDGVAGYIDEGSGQWFPSA